MNFYEKKYIDNKDYSSFGAFSYDKKVTFKLLIPRECGTTAVLMHLFGEGLENKTYRKYKFLWENFDGIYDVYSCETDMSVIGVGLYYYHYEVTTDHTFFLGDGERINQLSVVENRGSGNVQLLIYDEKSSSAKVMHGGIMYQIFVDRFCKSGRTKPKKHAIMNDDWYNGIPQFADYPGGYVENNMFFGGDLYGVIEKLDYIKSLGVNCIYLCPIFDAYSNHKYDTGDYMSIDSMFGTEETFESLIVEAKKRDIRIILDGVFNHTGSNSVYFNKNGNYPEVGAYQSKNSKYFEWYNFRSFPNDYECWWDVKILPRVNSNCQSYKDFILGENGVIEKWMKKGIAGFRLDVADELSDDFLRTLNSKVKSINPDGVVYGEVWEDASNKIAYDIRKKYFLGNELDSVMNYPLRIATINYVKNGDAEGFYRACKTIYNHYPKHNADLLMNFLGTHDTERILTVLGDEVSEGLTNEQLSRKRLTKAQRSKAKTLLKLAYAIIATIPGIPCIYYGDEAGMEGHRDPFNRMPFPWGKEDSDLCEFFQKVGKIRRNEPLYKDGYFKIIEVNSDILTFVRHNDNEFVATVINRGKEKYYIDSSAKLKNLETGRVITSIKPNSAYILKCNERIDDVVIEFKK
ncbi:MAG: glycoside hydrolase family 13 protein [Clostridia bacterium]|nr:glycoside hydrolase family 13 protein [Clostridia bacterium]